MFAEYARYVFEPIGKQLNKLGGILKLTPDFGRFSGLADILAEYTEHSLGISCNSGGCGGKSSFTTTGILEFLDVGNFYLIKQQLLGRLAL